MGCSFATLGTGSASLQIDYSDAKSSVAKTFRPLSKFHLNNPKSFHEIVAEKIMAFLLSGSKWFNMGNSIAAWPSNREAIDVENPTKGWIILKNSIAKTTTKVWSIRWASTSNVETTLFLKVKLAILIL